MIHPTAIIDKEAVLGTNVSIGAYCLIEKGVQVGNDVVISALAHIKGNTFIADGNFVGTGAVIGEVPQMLGDQGVAGGVRIGRHNVIREYATIHSSVDKDKATVLGDNNFLMALSHIAHDCILGNNIVVCNHGQYEKEP
jgi:UDP-N-acetylglucosamine acyltransferase